MRLELRKLNENQVEALDALVGVLHIHDVIVVIVFRNVVHEHVVDKVERINGLQQIVVFLLVELAHVCLRSVEEHALHELLRPDHLHLHKKLAAILVMATHVDDAVLLQRVVGHHLNGDVLHALYEVVIV